MINAEEWLNKEYPIETRNEIEKIDANIKNLQGELIIEGWNNLLYIKIETSSFWFEYSKGKLLLKISNLPKLVKVEVANCNIAKLDINNCPKIKHLNVEANHLTGLDFLNNINFEKLTDLIVDNNNFLPQNLSAFSNLVNLCVLSIEHNSFFGSLGKISKLTKLRNLNISDTDVDSGLEYLPESLKTIRCRESSTVEIRHSIITKYKVKKIKDLLKAYNDDIKKWREDYVTGNPLLVVKSQLAAKEKQIQELQEKINGITINQVLIEKLQKEKTDLQKELKDLQVKYNELLNKELTNSLKEKELELEKMKKKFSKEQFVMEDLLEAEEYLSSCDISSVSYYHQEAKEKNISRLKGCGIKQEDIDELCQLQSEITHLKLELGEMKKKGKLAIEGSKETKYLEDSSYPIFSQELMVKVNDFLQAKQNFLVSREKTIKELKICVNELEKQFGKHEMISEICNTVSNVGGAVTDVTTFGIPKAVGEAIKSGNNFSKIRISNKSSEEFQTSLGDEENELVRLSDAYNSLFKFTRLNKELEISSIISNIFHLEHKKVRIFSNKCKIFDILKGEGIWEGRFLNIEKMEKVITSLDANLELLKTELEQEEKLITELQERLVNQEKLENKIEIPPKQN